MLHFFVTTFATLGVPKPTRNERISKDYQINSKFHVLAYLDVTNDAASMTNSQVVIVLIIN